VALAWQHAGLISLIRLREKWMTEDFDTTCT